MDKHVLLTDILEILRKEAHSDDNVYFTVFRELSENGSLVNYSKNKNGVFFNMASFDSEKLKKLKNSLENYIQNKALIDSYESSRSGIISDINKNIYHPKDSSSDLKETLKSKILSTTLDSTLKTDLLHVNKNEPTSKETPFKSNYAKNKLCEKRIKEFKDDGGLTCLVPKYKPSKGIYEKIWRNMYSSSCSTVKTLKEEDPVMFTRKNSIAEDDELELFEETLEEENDFGSEMSFKNDDDEACDTVENDSFDKEIERELFGDDSDTDEKLKI